MEQRIKIKESNRQETHTTKTVFLSVENYLGNFKDIVKIHSQKKEGSDMIIDGISNLLINADKKDELLNKLFIMINDSNSKKMINLVKKIENL